MFSEYNIAFNDAIQQFIDLNFGNDANTDQRSFEWTQQSRDNLSTLIKVSAPTLTNGTTVTTKYGSFTPTTFPTPADYYDFISLTTISGGYTHTVRPTTYNELSLLLQDLFKMPDNDHPYYLEGDGIYTIWHGTESLTSAQFTYLKIADTFSIGNEVNLIGPLGTLTNGVTYIAVEDSIVTLGSTFVAAGDTYVSAGTTLASGSMIRESLTVPIELPERTHDQICKMAASNMLKNINLADQAFVIESEQSKS